MMTNAEWLFTCAVIFVFGGAFGYLVGTIRAAQLQMLHEERMREIRKEIGADD